ncbi:MAG: argininosuccinate synthase [Candidatus Sumerlaeia bacterium]|nr:argininosuccinate synthase [Candidatus Sumerlaeia bacterium]
MAKAPAKKTTGNGKANGTKKPRAKDVPPKATYEPGGQSHKLTLKRPAQADIEPRRRGVKRVLVAYSGGLDTSVMIPWLIENYGCEVVAYSSDLGQGGDMPALKKKAKDTGALKCIIHDVRDEFVEDYIVPAIMANALYEGRYPMHTSLGRPLIAKHMVDVAKQEGCDALAHGCTGKGNDQCRFEFTFMALAPELRVIAPLREWEMRSRDDEFAYAEARGIYLPISREKPFSIDKNLYGCATECGELEDPWHVAPEEAFQDTKNPLVAPNEPEDVTIGFRHGKPESLNGKKMKTRAIIEKLTEIGNRHGVGRIDMIENRLVGIKSREVYEAPAATMLVAAHRELEALALDKETQRFKEIVDLKFIDLIYNGFWFSPLREALQDFIERSNYVVTGEVKLRLFKGAARPIARKCPNSLYDRKLATYEADDEFDHSKAEGFIRIYGMPLLVHSRRKKRGIV